MPRYDFRCQKCEHVWEDTMPSDVVKHHVPECPVCGSNFTKQVWLTAPKSPQVKQPYDLLDKGLPGGKIFSGPKISSKTST